MGHISKAQKENTDNYLDGLEEEGDPDVDEMKKIKAAWGRAGKKGTLADFAKEWNKRK